MKKLEWMHQSVTIHTLTDIVAYLNELGLNAHLSLGLDEAKVNSEVIELIADNLPDFILMFTRCFPFLNHWVHWNDDSIAIAYDDDEDDPNNYLYLNHNDLCTTYNNIEDLILELEDANETEYYHNEKCFLDIINSDSPGNIVMFLPHIFALEFFNGVLWKITDNIKEEIIQEPTTLQQNNQKQLQSKTIIDHINILDWATKFKISK